MTDASDSSEQVRLLKVQLDTHLESQNYDLVVSLLRSLESISMTKELLTVTRIGATVNRIRKSENRSIAPLAVRILTKWRDILVVSPLSTPKVDNESQSSSSTASKRRRSDLEDESISSKSLACSLVEILKPYRMGDAIRDKCVEMLVNALMVDTPNTRPDELILNLAQSIEASLYSEFKATDTKYKAKFRSKYLNLKDLSNPSLRADLVSGVLGVSHFCAMSPQEMASEERKQADRQIHQQNIMNARAAQDNQAETDQFKCGRCKQRKCKYYQLQTRSADEPMTTFVTCTNCGNRWKFC